MSKKAGYLPLRNEVAPFTGVYQPLGNPIENPGVLVKFVNQSTVTVNISTDGVTDMDIIPPDTFALYDIQTNKDIDAQCAFPRFTQFFVKGTAGTGAVYLVVITTKK